jgi:hypothetical protein
MDRSFLSQAEVAVASRAFVCVRLATYEDKEEGEFLKGLLRTRSGELENSVFAILSPDGKKKLARAGRSPHEAYRGAAAMAADMTRIAAAYKPKATPSVLPTVANVRLAMDVAAADNRPLVVVLGGDDAARQALAARVAALAWGKEFVGRFVYALGSPGKDLAKVSGAKPGATLLVVEPDQFGLNGKVLSQAAAGATDAQLAASLRAGLGRFTRKPASQGSHVREGHREGIFWDTVLPVTDPMEARARQRGRK